MFKDKPPKFTGGILFSCEPRPGFAQLGGNVFINQFNIFTGFFHFEKINIK